MSTELSGDALDLLEDAEHEASRKGHDVAGWFLHSDEFGYAAWLYTTTEAGDIPMWGDVEVEPTPRKAALNCLERAFALPTVFQLGES